MERRGDIDFRNIDVRPPAAKHQELPVLGLLALVLPAEVRLPETALVLSLVKLMQSESHEAALCVRVHDGPLRLFASRNKK